MAKSSSTYSLLFLKPWVPPPLPLPMPQSQSHRRESVPYKYSPLRAKTPPLLSRLFPLLSPLLLIRKLSLVLVLCCYYLTLASRTSPPSSRPKPSRHAKRLDRLPPPPIPSFLPPRSAGKRRIDRNLPIAIAI